MTDSTVSDTIPIRSNLRGLIGEIAVLGGRQTPPQPLKIVGHRYLKRQIKSISPDIDKISGHILKGAKTEKIRNLNGTFRWKPDGRLKLSWKSGIKEVFGDSIDQYSSMEFPLEIKTGEYAVLERNQRAVMKDIYHNSERCPIIAKVNLDAMPKEVEISASLFQDD